VKQYSKQKEVRKEEVQNERGERDTEVTQEELETKKKKQRKRQ
jgi:hypothetical protein